MACFYSLITSISFILSLFFPSFLHIYTRFLSSSSPPLPQQTKTLLSLKFCCPLYLGDVRGSETSTKGPARFKEGNVTTTKDIEAQIRKWTHKGSAENTGGHKLGKSVITCEKCIIVKLVSPCVSKDAGSELFAASYGVVHHQVWVLVVFGIICLLI